MGDGRESEPHITVKYGIDSSNAAPIREAVMSHDPIEVELGETSIFSNDKEDVVKVDVKSKDLASIRGKIAESVEAPGDTHPDYQPHVTLAYVKPGAGEKYAGDTSLQGKKVKLDQLTFSAKDGSKIVIPLLGAAAALLQKGSLPQAQAIALQEQKGTGAPMRLRATTAPVGQAMYPLSPLLEKEKKTGHRVVVSIPDKRVVVFDKDGKEIRSYGAYIGTAQNPTPRGQFRIMQNIKPDPNKEWYYGGHWMGIAINYDKPGSKSYAGFHGWVYDRDDDAQEKQEPGWKTSTHGCVQLSNKDVADLAEMVGAGDPVSIIDSPLLPPPHPLAEAGSEGG